MQGCNIIDNGLYAFYAYACHDPDKVIYAENNWWGVTDSASIEDMVRHQVDNSSVPLVDFVPFAASAFEIGDPVGILETPDGNVPAEFALRQNYPNPFNLGTTIEFNLPKPGDVEITIYDILGRRVRQLASGYYPAGVNAVQFDGRDSYGMPLPSGMYFYFVRAGNLAESKKMVLMK